jgi:dihydroflavonol-4-reductase
MILVTGATGLVGAHLTLRLLEKNAPVRALFRLIPAQQKTRRLFRMYGREDLFDKIEWVQGDINDIPSLENAFVGIDQVYHCAALISFNPKDEKRLRKINIEGTANIVNLCLHHGVDKLCYMSSVAALGDPLEDDAEIDEDTPWNPEKPHSDYARSKYGAELEVWRGYQEGLKTVIVAPGIIVGPGFWNEGSGEIFSSIEKGFPFYATGSTGFVAVADVVRAMLQLMESEVSGERYTLIGEHLILRDLSWAIADALKVKRPSIKVTPGFARFAVFVDWFLSIFGKKRKLFPETANALHRHRRFSTEKISTTGFQFTPVVKAIPEIVRIHKGRA